MKLRPPLLALLFALPILTACVNVKIPSGIVGDTVNTAKGLYRDLTGSSSDSRSGSAAQTTANSPAGAAPISTPLAASVANQPAVPVGRIFSAIHYGSAAETVAVTTQACVAQARRQATDALGAAVLRDRVLATQISVRGEQTVFACTIEVLD